MSQSRKGLLSSRQPGRTSERRRSCRNKWRSSECSTGIKSSPLLRRGISTPTSTPRVEPIIKGLRIREQSLSPTRRCQTPIPPTCDWSLSRSPGRTAPTRTSRATANCAHLYHVMDCTITTYSLNRSRSRGMTLVELQIASAISVILFAAVMALAFYTARSFAAFTNYVDLDANSRNTLDVMSTEIRQADFVKAATPTSLTLQTTDLGTGATHDLQY